MKLYEEYLLSEKMSSEEYKRMKDEYASVYGNPMREKNPVYDKAMRIIRKRYPELETGENTRAAWFAKKKELMQKLSKERPELSLTKWSEERSKYLNLLKRAKLNRLAKLR